MGNGIVWILWFFGSNSVILQHSFGQDETAWLRLRHCVLWEQVHS